MPSGWITGGNLNTTFARVMNSSGSAMYMNAYGRASTTKFVPSSETISSINVETGNNLFAGVGYSAAAGYLLGGIIFQGDKSATFTDLIKKFLFSTETYSTVSAVLPAPRQSNVSFNTSTACYNLSASSAVYQKFTFATETLADAGGYNGSYANMQSPQGNGCYSTAKGYMISNNTASFGSGPFNTIASYSFSTGTQAAVAQVFSVARGGNSTGSTQSSAI